MSPLKPNSTHPLDIKKNSILRVVKEYEGYKKELDEAKSNLDRLKEKGDEHEVRKAQELVDECLSVIEDAKRRIRTFATDMEIYLVENVEPMLRFGSVPEMCREMVADSEKLLVDLGRKYPELGYEYTRSIT